MDETHPQFPAPYEDHHMAAVKLLERGDCPPHLQKEFLKWLIESVCGTYQPSYRDDDRQTVFAEGSRHVGLTLVKMLHITKSVKRSDYEPSENI